MRKIQNISIAMQLKIWWNMMKYDGEMTKSISNVYFIHIDCYVTYFKNNWTKYQFTWYVIYTILYWSVIHFRYITVAYIQIEALLQVHKHEYCQISASVFLRPLILNELTCITRHLISTYPWCHCLMESNLQLWTRVNDQLWRLWEYLMVVSCLQLHQQLQSIVVSQ